MSFQQGLSGLNGAAKSLDVIGNNIANSSTVGFKGSTTQFADVYASSLNGAGGNSPGIGVKVAAIAQQFTQGNIEATNNPLDIAINGSGFFRVESAGVVQYSRNGQFSLDKSGNIVNAQGAQLTGYGVGINGQISAGAPQPLRIDTADQPPKVTSKIDIELQLDSRSPQIAKTPFNVDDSDTYTKQSPMSVYDTLGNPHTLSSFYVKTGPGTWDVYASMDGYENSALKAAGVTQTDATVTGARSAWEGAAADGKAAALKDYATKAATAIRTEAAKAVPPPSDDDLAAITSAAETAALVPGTTPEQVNAAILTVLKVTPEKVGTLNFNTNGRLNMATSGTAPTFNGQFKLDLQVVPSTGAELKIPVTFDFAGTTQYGTTTSEKRLEQDGYKAGALQRFSTGKDGVILGQYSNGQTKPLGQVILANFTNPNGLEPLGNNTWAESPNSGGALIGIPNTGGMGVLQSSATEASSVDLTAELVNMITAQRAYQANAQTIKTQDSVLQTLVNLR